MIFVTLGTSKLKFNRIIDYINSANLKDVVIQSGSTIINNSDYEVRKYLTQEEMKEYINKADYIISHGGIVLMEALEKGKKVICVPRQKKYHECVENFQKDYTDYLFDNNYILLANTKEEFDQCIKNIKKCHLRKYRNNSKTFYNKLGKILDNYLVK